MGKMRSSKKSKGGSSKKSRDSKREKKEKKESVEEKVVEKVEEKVEEKVVEKVEVKVVEKVEVKVVEKVEVEAKQDEGPVRDVKVAKLPKIDKDQVTYIIMQFFLYRKWIRDINIQREGLGAGWDWKYRPRYQKYPIQHSVTWKFLDIYGELWILGEDLKAMSTSWVQERRLRPIYELLDGGNNKKVIAEVDRLLKKQPNFLCARVLKALALIRMNKPDEARMLLAPAVVEIPTDDSTIQALSICYRELEEPTILSTILEAACEKEKSEELLTHCFMAQVRINDYKKMHTTALQLYKLFNKTTYYGWVVASLVLKHNGFTGPLEQADMVTLEIAARMMGKFAGDQKGLLDDNMLCLYVTVLRRLFKWQEMIDVLKAAGYPRINWQNDDYFQWYIEALSQLKLDDELFEYLKSTYLKNQEEYAVLKQLIDLFGDSDTERVNSLMNDLMENSRNRAVVLADLYFSLSFVYGEEGIARIARDIKIAIEYTVDKPSFYSDIIDYFKLVGHDVQLAVVEAAAPHSDGEPNFDTIGKIIRNVNHEIIYKDAILFEDDNLSRLRQANVCFGKYLVCDKLMDSLRSNNYLRTKESDYNDNYIIVTAVDLLSEYYKSQPLRDGCDVETYLKSKPWTELDGKDTAELKELKGQLGPINNQENTCPVDGLAADIEKLEVELNHSHVYFNNKESFLAYAICVLEYGLAKSPHNYSMRILLSKAYATVGAVWKAIKVIKGLDLKHVQWDTLGYLIFPQALTSGTYSEVMRMITAADSMYTSYKRESMEHIIAAYKFGSFGKIQEFLSFRLQLLESTQCGITFTEKRLLELMLASNSASHELLKLAESISIETLKEFLTQTEGADNRDITILQSFDDMSYVSLIKEMTSDLDYFLLKHRCALLFILTKLILFSKCSDTNELKNVINAIADYEQYHKTWKGTYRMRQNDAEQLSFTSPQFHAILPPRAFRYFDLGAPTYILDQLKFVQEVLIDHEKPQLGSLQAKIEEQSDTLLDLLRKNHKALIENKGIVQIETCLHDFHIVLETFSFTRIILEAVILLTKTFYDLGKPKGKQKERVNQGQRVKKSIGCTVRAVTDKFQQLHECFNDFIKTLEERPLPRLDQMQTSMKDVFQESFLYVAFQSNFDVAQRDIRKSHMNQLEEMRKHSWSLVECIRSYIEPK